MKKYYLFAGLVLLAANPLFAQTKIGAAGAADASAMLEVTSGTTNNKGLLLPRMTTAQRNTITSPATGLMIYNTTTNETQINTGTPAAPVWAAANSSTSGWNTTGNAGSAPATNFIGTTDNQPLVVRTNNTEKVRITAAGNVGIGTAAPATRLHVDTGAIRVSNGPVNNANPAIQVINDGGGQSNNDNIIISSYGANTLPSFSARSARGTLVAPENSQAGDPIGNLYFSGRANGVLANTVRISGTYLGDGTNNKGNLVFNVSGKNGMVIDSSGYVGIGTSNPAAKLHVDTGSIRISNGPNTVSVAAIQVINDGGGNTTNDNIVIQSYGTSTAPSMGTFVARGTLAAPLNSQAGDNMGNFYSGARVNGTQTTINQIGNIYVGNGINNKSRMTFLTSGTLAMQIDSNQNVKIFGNANLDGGVFVRADTNIAYSNGSLHTWNMVNSGQGETEFINYRGSGSGGFRFFNVTQSDTASNANDIASINSLGAYTQLSDMRLKTNVNTVNDGLEKVMALRPVTYDFHTSKRLKNGVVTFAKDDQIVPSIGFLAQELEKVVPQAVEVPKDPANELYKVSYAAIVPVLTKAIQEQQAQIEALKARNEQLEAANKVTAQLVERVKQMEQMMGINEIEGTSKVAGK